MVVGYDKTIFSWFEVLKFNIFEVFWALKLKSGRYYDKNKVLADFDAWYANHAWEAVNKWFDPMKIAKNVFEPAETNSNIMYHYLEP